MNTKFKEFGQDHPKIKRLVTVGGFALTILGLACVDQIWNNYADTFEPSFSSDQGREVVRGPGYFIKQIEPNSQIVYLNNDHFWWASVNRGITRGYDWLRRSCGEVTVLGQHPSSGSSDVSYLLKIELPADKVNQCLTGQYHP